MSKPNNNKECFPCCKKQQARLLPAFLFSLAASVSFSQSWAPLTVNAGNNTGICPNDSVRIGGNPTASGGTPPYFYSWSPATGLDFPNVPNPNAFPAAPTDYTVTVTDGSGATATDAVYVALYPLPTVNAGPNQTILQGTNTQLMAAGAVNYYWTPTAPLINQNSASPTAEPSATTVFWVVGEDANGCINADSMVVYVIPSDTIIIYNSFTPNGDNINDFFYISNIEKFPDNKLEVFNRNGKLVYQKSPYANDWFGRIDGTEIPCATYYYVFTPGAGKPKRRGAVTIIR